MMIGELLKPSGSLVEVNWPLTGGILSSSGPLDGSRHISLVSALSPDKVVLLFRPSFGHAFGPDFDICFDFVLVESPFGDLWFCGEGSCKETHLLFIFWSASH